MMPVIHTRQIPYSTLPTCKLPVSTARRGRVSLRSTANRHKSSILEPRGVTPCCPHRAHSCRCQASDSNGKPGLLFGLKNPFRGLRFGLQGNDNDTNQAEQEEAQQQQAADTALAVGHSMPWKAWNEHFDAMDDLAQKMQNVQSALGLATAFEKYSEAADLKKELDQLNANDVVEQVLEGYTKALQEEDYAEAARLRDQGAAGLRGWWVADNKEDPGGHLLRITTGFGRYMGYAYTPQDLAQAEGLPTDEGSSMLQQSEEVQPCSLDEVGTPVLELFLKKAANGDMQQQGTVLSLPPELLSQAQSSLQRQISDIDLTSDKMWVSEERDENGGPVVSISYTLRPSSSSLSSSTTPPALRPSRSSWGSKPSSSGTTLDGTEIGEAFQLETPGVIDLERTPATIAQTGRDQLEVTVHPQSLTDIHSQAVWATDDSDDSDSEDDEDSDDNSDDPFMTMVSISTDEDTDTEADSDRTLVFDKLFPGRAIMPSELVEESERATDIFSQLRSNQLTGQSTLRGKRIVHEDGSVEFQLEEVDSSASSTSGDESTSKPAEDKAGKPSWEAVVSSVLEVVQQLKHFAPEPGESAEERDKHAELMRKLDEAEKSLTSSPTQSSPTPKAATQPDSPPKRSIAEIMEDAHKALASSSNGKFSPEPAELEAIKQVTTELFQDHLPSLMQQLGATENPIIQASSGEGADSLKTMRYRRLHTNFVSTDPFTGLYLAAFGSHGPEVLQLSRQPDSVDDSVEWVIGTKLTGDSNVPAGEVSFKAKIGRGSRLGTPDMYPPDMGVIARYRGSGCVAQSGFQQPTWVDGELLHFSGDGASTRGAELGFVWSGNQNHFLIVLKRIDLSEQEC